MGVEAAGEVRARGIRITIWDLTKTQQLVNSGSGWMSRSALESRSYKSVYEGGLGSAWDNLPSGQDGTDEADEVGEHTHTLALSLGLAN